MAIFLQQYLRVCSVILKSIMRIGKMDGRVFVCLNVLEKKDNNFLWNEQILMKFWGPDELLMKNAPQDGPHKRNSKNIILYAIFSI
jgi:hypothetical protein